jgi:hypothetical protein
VKKNNRWPGAAGVGIPKIDPRKFCISHRVIVLAVHPVVVAILNHAVSGMRRVNRQGAAIRGLDFEIVVNAATADVGDRHAIALEVRIRSVNVIYHDVKIDRAALRCLPGAQDQMRATAQLQHGKILSLNNRSDPEFDKEIRRLSDIANRQSNVTTRDIRTRIVHE